MTIVYATPDELEALSMGEEIAVMRDGAVVQHGTPDELYESPLDTYVAGKIGSPHMNVIKAKLDSGAALSTALGKLAPPKKPKKLKDGDDALVGIRPNDIRLARKGEKALKTKIHLLEPLGDVTIVSVEAGGETLRLVLPESSATNMKPGDEAMIVLDPSKLHIFHANGSRVAA
jgi:ABC-type sugar transport system ATPase subunit